MFNFTYAIIGVLIGMAVQPVGRFAKYGPLASPQWTWNKTSRAVVAIAMWGFIIFSATFGFKYAVYAILEIVVGVFISYYLSPDNYESKFTNHWQLFKDKARGIYKSQKILREKKVRIGAVHNLIMATGVQMIYVFYYEFYYFSAKQDLVWLWNDDKLKFLSSIFLMCFAIYWIYKFSLGYSNARKEMLFINKVIVIAAIFPILMPIMEDESIVPYMINFIDTHVYLYLAALISIYTSIKLKSQEVKDWCDVK